MAKKKTPTQGLTIYLLKSTYQRAEDAIDEADRVTSHDLPPGSRRLGQLYVQRMPPKPPRWARFFADYLKPRELGLVSSASAILFVESADRLFAVTFGQGRHLLKPDCWEERFGLRVVLNSIGEQNVRSIAKSRINPLSLHSLSNASREASAMDFDIDIEQDLLRAITGSPKDTELGRRLSGMDALHTAIPTDLESLHKLLASYYVKFQDTTYRKTFPWVDQMAEVSSKVKVQELDDQVIRRIIKEDTDRIWMAVPDVLQWERVDKFQYGDGNRSPRFHDIHLPDFLDTIGDLRNLSKEKLTKRKVFCVDDDGIVIESWQAYRCLYAEIEDGGQTYFLTGGRWFRITTDFVQSVNQYFEKLPRYPHAFPEYCDESEKAYLIRVAESDIARYALMDRKNINIGGRYSRVEFCDIYTAEKDIVHVKRYGDASFLSHLFSQGQISGEAFMIEEEFRLRVNDELPKSHRVPDFTAHPRPQQYQVVFAVISDRPDTVHLLPFFSRLNLRNAAKRLTGFGYRVALAKIEVERNFALTTLHASTARRRKKSLAN